MNDQQRAAMQMALDALFTYEEDWVEYNGGVFDQVIYDTEKVVRAITALREALAQPQESDIEHHRAIKKRNAEVIALETAQP